jgi:hypothetical protein
MVSINPSFRRSSLTRETPADPGSDTYRGATSREARETGLSPAATAAAMFSYALLLGRWP